MGTFTPPSAPGIVWDGMHLDPSSMLGTRPAETVRPTGPPSSGLHGTGSSLDAGDKPWHPDSPLFWFGVVAAVTFGLIGASTAVRVGPFKASLGAGKP